MKNTPIWRYISLAKYIDLLRTQSLFFPKSSLFSDDTEGKWIGHAYLLGNRERCVRMRNGAELLEKIFKDCTDDALKIKRSARQLYQENKPELKSLRGIFETLLDCYDHVRPKILSDFITKWKNEYLNHNQEIENWTREAAAYKDSTFISCWNRANSMSLAMWALYGGGQESVALRTTEGKLEQLISGNQTFFVDNNLSGEITEVKYFDDLKNAKKDTREDVMELLDKEYTAVGLFSIKSSLFRFEEEIRAIVFPKTDLLKGIPNNPFPDQPGISLPFFKNDNSPPAQSFIDAVHLHPLLGTDSLMFTALQEINNKFNVPHIPLVADKIEAIGPSMSI